MLFKRSTEQAIFAALSEAGIGPKLLVGFCCNFHRLPTLQACLDAANSSPIHTHIIHDARRKSPRGPHISNIMQGRSSQGDLTVLEQHFITAEVLWRAGQLWEWAAGGVSVRCKHWPRNDAVREGGNLHSSGHGGLPSHAPHQPAGARTGNHLGSLSRLGGARLLSLPA
jgi:hypothetical protein